MTPKPNYSLDLEKLMQQLHATGRRPHQSLSAAAKHQTMATGSKGFAQFFDRRDVGRGNIVAGCAVNTYVHGVSSLAR